MRSRIEMMQLLADNSAKILASKLEDAIDQYKTVYLLTHFPPYAEANRSSLLLNEKFWEPYNTNFVLGQKLIKVMESHKKRNLIILSGHVHPDKHISIHASRNIECRVGKGSYYKISDEEIIFI